MIYNTDEYHSSFAMFAMDSVAIDNDIASIYDDPALSSL
jgi:hypothetical protein